MKPVRIRKKLSVPIQVANKKFITKTYDVHYVTFPKEDTEKVSIRVTPNKDGKLEYFVQTATYTEKQIEIDNDQGGEEANLIVAMVEYEQNKQLE
jgi:hypothetical protein